MEHLATVRQKWGLFMEHFPLERRAAVWSPASHPEVAILFIFRREHASKSQTSQEVLSVQAQAILAFAEYPHIVQECSQPDQSPSGHLPYLLTTCGKALAGREILDEVLNTTPAFGSHLSKTDRADALAFTSLGESKLHYGLIYDLWYNPINSEKVAFPKYAFENPWPLNHILPRLKRWEQLDWMLTQRVSINKDEILADVKTALAAFSTQLDQKQYLFGDK
ncbi:hypothetical protein HK100_001602 [Physocladia obscura]|uniref:Mitochondrial outer membrane transport complex Sam37/metaxin N-terminal domain-containing protein n=1 Tax=Physocladia obscura TaxID=109957 RepID=A0AAD5SY58_9FUNG|nr:hypothetical protein HK100_001602 [Physocladia obscura]